MLAQGTWALSTDRDEPATVEADEVEYDFRTGVRTYTGNVIVVQGTLRITGDKLVVEYNGDQLESATAWGQLASFKQRPDGKDQDVIGKGKKIVLNQIANTLTLHKQASLQQGPDTAIGEKIVYDITNDKLSIKGAATIKKKTDGTAGAGEPEKPGRAKVIITPRSTTLQ
jgi:lipopolysaccharide export system protein LptA